MINLSTCPRCLRMVTLPDGIAAAAKVRCPLCQAEYPLSEALELIPPALILVPEAEPIAEAPTSLMADFEPMRDLLASEPILEEPIAATVDSVGESVTAAEVPEETSAAEPADDFVINFKETAEQAEPLPVEENIEQSADVVPQESAESQAPSDFVLDFEDHLAESDRLPGEEEEEPEEFPDLALADGNYSASGGEGQVEENETALVKSDVSERPRPQRTKLIKPLPPRRPRKKRGPIRLLIETILGACVGLSLAYFGLWGIQGEPPNWMFSFLPYTEHFTSKPDKPSLPADKKKDITTANAAQHAGKQATVPPMDQIVQTEHAVNHEAPLEQTPDEITAPETEVKKILPSEQAATPTPTPTEPTPIEITPTEPTPPPEPKVGPRKPASFTSLDLDSAIDDATNAYFIKAGGKVNAESYAALCQLAQVDTYVPADKLSPTQQKTVQDLLANIAKDSKKIEEIGRLATEAVKNPGDTPGGILLAGKATVVRSSNGMFGAIVKLAGSDENVTVLSIKPLGFQANDDVLLVGGMIAKPAENIASYKGSSRLVVWLGTAAVVPAATEEK